MQGLGVVAGLGSLGFMATRPYKPIRVLYIDIVPKNTWNFIFVIPYLFGGRKWQMLKQEQGRMGLFKAKL